MVTWPFSVTRIAHLIGKNWKLESYFIEARGGVKSSTRFTVVHQETASPSNPFGVKGLGEGGAIGPPVAIANAVCDALASYGVEFNDTPITPQRIFEAVRVPA
jgi:hypothetical protein